MKKTRNGNMCHGKIEEYIQRQRHQTIDQNNYCLNNDISNYPVCSRNLEYQKGRVVKNVYILAYMLEEPTQIHLLR